MNIAETHDLLTFIAVFDNRRFDDATVLAWHPIFADVPFDDCRTAVTQHFATSSDYLLPVHIRRGADDLDRERRRIRREAGERLAIESEASDPTRYDRSEEVTALIGQLRTMLPESDPAKVRRAEWLEVERARDRAARAEPNPHYDPAAIQNGGAA